MKKHTELPWEIDKENVHTGQICTCHGDADTWYEVWTPNWQNGIDQKANAAFIVKACNNHYQLIENLQMIERFLTHIDPVHWPSRSEARQVVSNIREAIKQAESDND